jgi:site-specific DNA recombinase
MCDKLDNGDVQARKAYLRSVITRIEVDKEKVRIIGEKARLADIIAGKQAHAKNVRGFVRKWRARKDSNL